MTQSTQGTPEAPHWILMAKALKGELSDQEQLDFAAWLEEDALHAEEWASTLSIWDEADQIGEIHFTPDVDQAWQKARIRMDFQEPVSPSSSSIPISEEASIQPMFSWSSYLRYAAVAVLAIGLGWLGYSKWNVSSQWTEVATLAGQRKAFYLPDSSLVTLNENSTLRYQTAFTSTEREVEITGEGFFQVKKNPDQPFVVRSKGTETRVLGTSFNVKSLPQNKEVSVAVFTGKVAFSSAEQNKQILLTPGFTGILHSDGSVEKASTAENKPNWNTISFQGSTLNEVISVLENHFGVQVQVNNPELNQCTFTGTFENPEVQNVLQVLTVSLNLQLKREGSGTYQLTGAGCAQ